MTDSPPAHPSEPLRSELPPLRNRVGDALFFANYYLNECIAKTSGGPKAFSPSALAFIESYSWPGNVRQLKHAVYSAYYTSESATVDVDDFPAYIVQGACGKPCPMLSQNESYSSFKVQPQLDGYGIAIPDAAKGEAGERPAAAQPTIAEEPALAGATVARTGEPSPATPTDTLPTLALEELESLAIAEALKQADDNVVEAAKLLGISKATLYRKLKK